MFSANTSQVATAADTLYVEDVFSTYLYQDTNNFVTVNNGIDLLTKGGMVWLKLRNGVDNHRIADTARGAGYIMGSNTTAAQVYESAVSPNAFYNNGFRAYSSTGELWTSWTFRKAANFFDVVTVTGQPTQTTFNHNLGVAPGMIIIKDINNAGTNWFVYHRSTGSDQYLQLESTNGQAAFTGWCTATSTSVTVKSGVMGNGNSFVVYLFAHDTTSDGIIQCGSYTGNGSATGPTVTLGWEPQWVLVKNITTAGYDWWMLDTMRGFTAPSANDAYLAPNLSQAEVLSQDIMSPTATGFQLSTSGPMFNRSGDTFVYIAIRRGPMRTPTSGTSVFQPVTYTADNTDNRLINTGIVTDLAMARISNNVSTGSFYVADRLRGGPSVATALTAVENTDADSYMTPTAGYGNAFSSMNGFGVGNDVTRQLNYGTVAAQIAYGFKRAPSFFDTICWTGSGTNPQVLSHNLGVAPQLVINKSRNATANWDVSIFNAAFSGGVASSYFNTSSDFVFGTTWSQFNSPTATTVSITTASGANASGTTNVTYLFASCPGVSKVGVYTGNGSSQTINCGFTAGARFILIKRVNTAGNWYVWDTARGIVSGSDPYLLINTTDGEVTGLDVVDPDSSGFIINQDATTNLNVNGSTYLYLAVA